MVMAALTLAMMTTALSVATTMDEFKVERLFIYVYLCCGRPCCKHEVVVIKTAQKVAISVNT